MTTPSGDPTEPAADDASKPAPSDDPTVQTPPAAEPSAATEAPTAQLPPPAEPSATTGDPTAQLPPPAEPPATTPELPAAPEATPAYSLPPAGSEPSQAETTTPLGAAPPPPPPAPPPPPPPEPSPPPQFTSPSDGLLDDDAPPAAPPPASARPAAAEPREPSRVQRALPLLAAALIGGIVAGGIVAVVDGTRDTNVTVTNATPADAADQGSEAAPAPPASSEQQPATPPPASSQGGQAQPPPATDEETTPSPTPASSGAYLGIEPTPVDATLAGRVRLGTDSGVMVGGIAPDSPADGADLEAADSQITIDGQQYSFGGDTITAIDGEQVTSVDQLRQIIGSHAPGDTVQLTVVNADGEERTVDVTLGERPAEEQQETPQLQPDNGFSPTLPDGLQPPGFEQPAPGDDGSAS